MENKLVLTNLKEQLDSIDEEVVTAAKEYLQEGRYAILLGMWKKHCELRSAFR